MGSSSYKRKDEEKTEKKVKTKLYIIAENFIYNTRFNSNSLNTTFKRITVC